MNSRERMLTALAASMAGVVLARDAVVFIFEWTTALLHGDRLVGKVDATADRKAGVLRVDAIHEDEPLASGVSDAVAAELAELAAWLGLDLRLPAHRSRE